jgi:epoxyqueuosine reductase QueG
MVHEVLEKNLQPDSDYIFGFADLKGLIDIKFKGFRYGISIGKKLDDNIINRIGEGPTLEYYDYYKSINKELASLTQRIKTDLSAGGIESLPIEPTVSNAEEKYKDYLKTLSVDISHKLVATRAGLGWIGKTDLFVSAKFGPRLRLVSILLKDFPGDLAVPVNESRCGNCIICVEKCPAQAASGMSWNISVHRDEFFNAQKCRNKCAELARTRLNVDERICGLCVSVCPFGKKIKKNNYKNE